MKFTVFEDILHDVCFVRFFEGGTSSPPGARRPYLLADNKQTQIVAVRHLKVRHRGFEPHEYASQQMRDVSTRSVRLFHAQVAPPLPEEQLRQSSRVCPIRVEKLVSVVGGLSNEGLGCLAFCVPNFQSPNLLWL